MYGRDPWGGPLEINAGDSATDDDRSRNLQDLDRAALSSRPLDETQQSWLLGPSETKKKKKYVDLGCVIVSRKIFTRTLGSILAGLIIMTVPSHHRGHPLLITTLSTNSSCSSTPSDVFKENRERVHRGRRGRSEGKQPIKARHVAWSKEEPRPVVQAPFLLIK